MRFLCTYEMILHMSFFLLDFINLFILQSSRWENKNTPERPSEKSIILTVSAETYQLKVEAQLTKQRKKGIARLNLCSKILMYKQHTFISLFKASIYHSAGSLGYGSLKIFFILLGLEVFFAGGVKIDSASIIENRISIPVFNDCWGYGREVL